MKKIFGIILFCGFCGCQCLDSNNNVELTEFTKDLISLYVKEELDSSVENKNEEIIISSIADDTCYFLSIFANNPKEYKFCREDYIGKTIYLGYTIRFFGVENAAFFCLNRKIERQKKCSYIYDENYDPVVWLICLNKDNSLCASKTYKCSPDEDISEIQSLVERRLPISGDGTGAEVNPESWTVK